VEGPLFDKVGPVTTLSYGKRMFVIAASETASPDLRAQCYLAAFLVFCNMVPDVLAAYRACVDLSNVPPPAGCVLYESTVLDCLSVLVQRGPLPHELEFIPHLVTPEFARLLGRLVVDSPLAAVYFVKAPTTGLAKRPTALHARHCLRLHVLPALLFGPGVSETFLADTLYILRGLNQEAGLPVTQYPWVLHLSPWFFLKLYVNHGVFDGSTLNLGMNLVSDALSVLGRSRPGHHPCQQVWRACLITLPFVRSAFIAADEFMHTGLAVALDLYNVADARKATMRRFLPFPLRTPALSAGNKALRPQP